MRERQGWKDGDNTIETRTYTDNLYYPYKRADSSLDSSIRPWEGSGAYWLADLSSLGNALLAVESEGEIRGLACHLPHGCIRPVIKMSKTDFESATGITIQ